jgi:hypothetical protein
MLRKASQGARRETSDNLEWHRRFGRAMAEIRQLVDDDGVKDFDEIKKRIMEGE